MSDENYIRTDFFNDNIDIDIKEKVLAKDKLGGKFRGHCYGCEQLLEILVSAGIVELKDKGEIVVNNLHNHYMHRDNLGKFKLGRYHRDRLKDRE